MDFSFSLPAENAKTVGPAAAIAATTAISFTFGTGIGIINSFSYQKQLSVLQRMNHLAYYAVPVTAMGAVFGVMTYSAACFRKKNDIYDAYIGAISSAGVLQMWKRNLNVSINYIFVSCVLCYLYSQGAGTLVQRSPRMVTNFYRTYYETRPEKWEM